MNSVVGTVDRFGKLQGPFCFIARPLWTLATWAVLLGRLHSCAGRPMAAMPGPPAPHARPTYSAPSLGRAPRLPGPLVGPACCVRLGHSCPRPPGLAWCHPRLGHVRMLRAWAVHPLGRIGGRCPFSFIKQMLISFRNKLVKFVVNHRKIIKMPN